MTQAIGCLLILFGALCWHVASANLPHSSVQDIWDDFGKVMRGENA